MFGSPNQAAPHIFLGYQLQSSIFGLPIPIIYGQQRMAGNVIWTGNWQANPYSGSGGKGSKGGKAGKSGAGGQIYTYSSAIIIALCGGPVRGIGYVWVNKVRLAVSSASEPILIPSDGSPVVPGNAGIQTATDTGVTDITTGLSFALFTPTGVNPNLGKGQYSYNNGTYTFSLLDGGTTVLINSTGQTFAIPNPNPGAFIPNQTASFTAATTTSNLITDSGVYQAVTYNATATDYGNPAGAVSLIGNQQIKFRRVPSNPQSGQYTFDPTVGYVFSPFDAGQLISINYTWNDPNYLTDGNPVQSLNLTLFGGEEGQAPWDYLETNFPSQALGYSGLSYLASNKMDLGFSGALDNYGFEVLGLFPFGGGIIDAAIPDVIQHFLSDPFVGAGFPAGAIGDLSELRNYTIASNIFISCVVDSQRTAADWLSDWMTIANCEAVWSNGVLKFRAYGDKTVIGNGVTFTPVTSPIYDLDDDDFTGDAETALLSVTRPTIRDAYNSVSVEWTNRANNYSAEPVEERDDWSISQYGLRPAPVQQLHSITTSTVGQMVANTALQRSVYIRNQYKFKLSAVKYQLLEPMDMVTLTEPEMGLLKTPVRIKSISEDDKLELEFECEEFPWGTATPTLFPKQNIGPFGPVYYQNPGNTLPVLFYEPDPPAVISGGVVNTLYIGLAGAQNWGGCHVYASTDGGKSYVHVGKQTGTSTVGYLTAPLPPVTSPDDTSTLSLDMSISQAELLSYTQSQENNLVPLCVIDQELISYRTAKLTGNNQWDLTHMQRAAYESPLSQHSVGSPFGFFDDAMFVWEFDESNVNTTVYFKFLSFNKAGLMPQTLDKVPAYPYFIHGRRPPYPWSTHDPFTENAPNDLYRSPNFGLWEKLLTDVNGNITPQFTIAGFGTVNVFSKATVAPSFGAVTVSPTGGTIKGNQVVVLGVFAQASDNLFTRMALMSVEVPAGSDTNRIDFTVSFANPTDQGWIAITTDPEAGWFGPGIVAVPTNSTASLTPQMTAMANAYLASSHAAGVDVDHWLFFYQQITGVNISPVQAEAVIVALGETDATRTTPIALSTFLTVLPTVIEVASYTFTEIGELDTPVPDEQFDHYVVQARVGYVLGATGQAITSINYQTGEISMVSGANAPAGTQAWVGRTVTCYAMQDATNPLVIFDEPIVAQTDTTISVDPASLIDSSPNASIISTPLTSAQEASLIAQASLDASYPNFGVDKWLFYWTLVTGVSLAGGQVEKIILSLGLTDATRATVITVDQFLTALPAAASFLGVGDHLLVRLTCTGFAPGRVEDNTLLFWKNDQLPNGPSIFGMTPNAYVGKVVFLTRGTGAGQFSNVVSNDSIGFNVSPAFEIVPDATTEFVVINSSVDYETDTSPLTFSSLESGVSSGALTSELSQAATQYLLNTGVAGVDVDHWMFFYQQITGIPISPVQAEAIIIACGLSDATRTSFVPLGTFLEALPGAGTPIFLTLNVDNSWQHYFIQVLTVNNENIRSLPQFSPYRMIFQPGFSGPNNFGTPQDTFYIGYLPGGLPGPIPAGGTSTLSVETVPGILFGWDAVAEINNGTADTVFDILRTRTEGGVTTTVSIFNDPSQYITIPGGSTLIASGTAFSTTSNDIRQGDILQLVVISVDGSSPAERATVNLFWKNNPLPGGVVGQ